MLPGACSVQPLQFPAMNPSDDTGRRRRSIRSFVRRTGRITVSQRRALDELWPAMGVDFEPTAIDLEALFGRSAPVVLEIGFGNGDTLVVQAAAHPECNFLGVEVHEPGVGHCLLAARAAGLGNLRLIRHDAIEVLQRQLGAGSLARVNLYFPDPWPKKRHHKRRIVQPAFLELLADRLAPGGTLHIATDWQDYAAQIDEVAGLCPYFECEERRVHAGDRPLDRPQTKFELRGLRRGHRIRDWRFRRLDNAVAGLATPGL